MTLQTLSYIVEIARCKSFSQAAKALYMSQSSLSAAVKELEQELGIQIFIRNNRGVVLTPEGEDCLTYARDILDRSHLLALRYKEQPSEKSCFSVSTQHLPYAVRAFEQLSQNLASEEFDIAVRETATSNVLYDVSTERSELGILAVSAEHLSLMAKSIHAYNLTFTELANLKTYVFVRRQHPLAAQSSLSMDDLKGYPFVTYDQEDAPGYHTEEALIFLPLKQIIRVCDRASKMLMIRNSNAFSIGVDLSNFNRDIYFSNKDTELTAIPVADYPSPIITGYLQHTEHELSTIGRDYLALLQRQIQSLKPPGSAATETMLP